MKDVRGGVEWGCTPTETRVTYLIIKSYEPAVHVALN